MSHFTCPFCKSSQSLTLTTQVIVGLQVHPFTCKACKGAIEFAVEIKVVGDALVTGSHKLPQNHHIPPEAQHTVLLYTDGGCLKNPGPAAAGIVCMEGASYFEGYKALGEGTNNIAELSAIGWGLERLEDHTKPVKIFTDSEYCIGMLSKGYKAKANGALIAQIKRLMTTFASIEFVKVRGHSGDVWNDRADLMATLGLHSLKKK